MGHTNITPGQGTDRKKSGEESGVLKLRYPKKAKKDGSRPDYFVGFWNELNVYAKNMGIKSSRKAARKYILSFLDDLKKCNDSYENIYTELLDSAGLYLNCCRSDRNFSSEFFGLSRMSNERLDCKIADLVDKISVTLMENTGIKEEGEIISKAIIQAFQEQFPEDRTKR